MRRAEIKKKKKGEKKKEAHIIKTQGQNVSERDYSRYDLSTWNHQCQMPAAYTF